MTTYIMKSAAITLPKAGDPGLPRSVRDALESCYDQAFEEGQLLAGAALARQLAAVIRTIEETREEALDNAVAGVTRQARAIVDLAVDLAAWFVQEAVSAEPQAVERAIEAQFLATHAQEMLDIRVHPSVADALGKISDIALRPDASLGPADFSVQTNGPTVERVFDEAMARIRDELIAELGASAPAVPTAAAGQR